MVRLAIFPRHHTHHFTAFHFCFEAATHTAIGAGRYRAVLGDTNLDHGLFSQSRGWASLYASATRNALRLHERFILACRHARVKTTAINRQRKRTLGLFAGAYAAVADDALGRVVGEVRIRLILLQLGVGLDRSTAFGVTHFAQANQTSHVLQFAIAIGGASQAIERVIGNVQLHHAATNICQLRRLRADFHARLDRRGARSRVAPAAFNLYQTYTARTEGFQ